MAIDGMRDAIDKRIGGARRRSAAIASALITASAMRTRRGERRHVISGIGHVLSISVITWWW